MNWDLMTAQEIKNYFSIKRDIYEYLDMFDKLYYKGLQFIPSDIRNTPSFIHFLFDKNHFRYGTKSIFFDTKIFKIAIEDAEEFLWKFNKNVVGDIITNKDYAKKVIELNRRNIEVIDERFLDSDFIEYEIDNHYNNYIECDICLETFLQKRNLLNKKIIEKFKNIGIMFDERILKQFNIDLDSYYSDIFEIDIKMLYKIPKKFWKEKDIIKYIKIKKDLPFSVSCLDIKITEGIVRAIFDADEEITAMLLYYLDKGNIEMPKDVILELMNRNYKYFNRLQGFPDDEIRLAALFNLELSLL